jgi:hypothetical protein
MWRGIRPGERNSAASGAAGASPSSLASSCAVGADTNPRGPASAHHISVDRPNQAGTPANCRASVASSSRIADSYGACDGGPEASTPVQATCAHTSRPRSSPAKPVRPESPLTMSKPRPRSPSGLSTTCGSVRPPWSATASTTAASCQVISTVNQPPGRPLPVCLMALLPSSVATVARSSRAEHGGSSSLSHRRNAASWRSSPGNTRRHRKPVSRAGKRDGSDRGAPVAMRLTMAVCK